MLVVGADFLFAFSALIRYTDYRNGRKVHMEQFLKEQLLKTGYVHFPLEANPKGMMEPRQLAKAPVETVTLWNGENNGPWRFEGEGQYTFAADGLALETSPVSNSWPEGESPSGHYATFGAYTAHLDISSGDLARYNRLVFEIKPECDGLHSPCIRAGFVNDGEKKIPDAYSREGFHCINLQNHIWNTCVWEYDSIPHDRMTDLFFRVHKYGRELSSGDRLRYTLRNVRLERIESPDVKAGWTCQADTISYSTTGYWTHGQKTAVANVSADLFALVEADSGKPLFEGKPTHIHTHHGPFTVLDFSVFEKPGTYCLTMGGAKTESFAISDTVMENAVWKMINFLFCERCGYPVPGKHSTCHADILAEHDGLTLIYNGGWHDAADVSQQTLQTAEVVHALLEASQAVGDDELLKSRLLEEALWGLDFILRMKFPDGYRATSAGIRRWNDGYIGTMDDERARVFSNPFDHLIISGVEAYAAKVFETIDPPLAWRCAQEARRDLLLGIELFTEKGMQMPYQAEHSYNASLSQYYAAACWSAALIYQLDREPEFAALTARYAKDLIACQDVGEAGLSFQGFFYRDKIKKSIVHFNHQSRDQLFAQALDQALRALPEHDDKAAWEAALERHGEYLKALMTYAAPYGMLPAGVYALSEVEDKETFAVMNMLVNFEKEKKNHEEQIAGGIPVGSGYFVKQFPVCFSYRGNTAMVLAMGKAAGICGRYLGDAELIEICRGQLYWIVGQNPFGQSLIYGEGHNYGQQYTALLGETVGAIAVGVETQENKDLPYWPPANIATYREVWTSSASRWLWAVSEVYAG